MQNKTPELAVIFRQKCLKTPANAGGFFRNGAPIFNASTQS
jgi:hypothetical protein